MPKAVTEPQQARYQKFVTKIVEKRLALETAVLEAKAPEVYANVPPMWLANAEGTSKTLGELEALATRLLECNQGFKHEHKKLTTVTAMCKAADDSKERLLALVNEAAPAIEVATASIGG